MKKFKNFINEPSFIRSSLFIVFNAFLLYVLYFIIKNFDHVVMGVSSAAGQLLSAFSPLFIGLVAAYLLDPLVTRIDKHLLQRAFVKSQSPENNTKRKESICRMVSILITFIIVLTAIVLIIYGFTVMILGQFVFTDIFATVDTLLNHALSYESEFRLWISQTFPEGYLGAKIMEVANIIISWISDNFSATSAVSAVSGAVGSVVNFVIGLIISIYLLKDKDLFVGIWNKFLSLITPDKTSRIINGTLHEIDEVLSLFIRGALLDALFVAILSSIGLSILGIDFAVFIGIFAGLCNVIPYFGPVLGMIPAFIMGWLTEDIIHGLLAILILLIVQQIDSNIIYPKVVGSSTGLHPLAVLLAVSVFGYFGGILGMLLAVPTAGVIQIFIKKWIRKRETSIAVKKQKSVSDAPYVNNSTESELE